MFSEGGFADKKCTKIVFVFSRGSAPDPAEGTTTQRSPRSRSPLGEGNTSCPFPCPSTHSVSRCCPVRFLPRDAMHPRYMLWPCVCVCLSVCLSVTSRSSTKTAKHRITQTTPHDSPGTLVFLMPKISVKFNWGHPRTGAPNAGGVGQCVRLSTIYRLYLENGTRQTHGFY